MESTRAKRFKMWVFALAALTVLAMALATVDWHYFLVRQLQAAASDGSVWRIQTIGRLGVRPTGSWATSPLTLAAQNGHLEAVRVMLDMGAEMSGSGKAPSPMEAAASARNIAIISLLLERGDSAAIAVDNAVHECHAEATAVLIKNARLNADILRDLKTLATERCGASSKVTAILNAATPPTQ